MGCPHSREVDAAFSFDARSGRWLAVDACCRPLRSRCDASAAATAGNSDCDGLRDAGFGRTGDDAGPLALSAEQRRLIRETWTRRLSPHLTAVGKQVFLRIFEFRPSVKRMFPFRDAWGDRLIRHPQFLEQARRFMRVLSAVVGSADALRAGRCGSPALYELGRRHVTIEGFLPDYFDVFTRAVTAVWQQELRDEYTVDVADAWCALFSYIIQQMKDGYEDEWRNGRDLR